MRLELDSAVAPSVCVRVVRACQQRKNYDSRRATQCHIQGLCSWRSKNEPTNVVPSLFLTHSLSLPGSATLVTLLEKSCIICFDVV